MKSTIELTGLALTPSLGTYGPNDVVPSAHLLNLTLAVDPKLVFVEADGMEFVFDYDPLILEIDRLANEQHYETQERLITRIVLACSKYSEIEAVDIYLSKQPTLRDSGELGVRLRVEADELTRLRNAST